jgi:hypothetical protein
MIDRSSSWTALVKPRPCHHRRLVLLGAHQTPVWQAESTTGVFRGGSSQGPQRPHPQQRPPAAGGVAEQRERGGRRGRAHASRRLAAGMGPWAVRCA